MMIFMNESVIAAAVSSFAQRLGNATHRSCLQAGASINCDQFPLRR